MTKESLRRENGLYLGIKEPVQRANALMELIVNRAMPFSDNFKRIAIELENSEIGAVAYEAMSIIYIFRGKKVWVKGGKFRGYFNKKNKAFVRVPNFLWNWISKRESTLVLDTKENDQNRPNIFQGIRNDELLLIKLELYSTPRSEDDES